MDFGKIRWLGLPNNRYYREEYRKTQIVLHHTASGKGTNGDFQWWLNDPKRIATFMILGHDGLYYQCFSSKYWAHHIGMANVYNTARNRGSIGIEIDSWGPVAKYQGKFYSYTGTVLPPSEVYFHLGGFKTYPDSPFFRKIGVVGKPATCYERYDIEQLASLKPLLSYLCTLYDIPITYNSDMWDYSKDAVEGKPGIWTHVSYRKDKSDCHPQESLIKLIKEL